MGKKTWFKFPHNTLSTDPVKTMLIEREYAAAMMYIWFLERIAEEEDATGQITGRATFSAARIKHELNLHYKVFEHSLKFIEGLLNPHWMVIGGVSGFNGYMIECVKWAELQNSRFTEKKENYTRRESQRVEKREFFSTLPLSGLNNSLVSIPTNESRASGIDFINTLDRLDVSELIKCYGDALVRKEIRQMKAFLQGQTADDLKSQPNTPGNLHGWLANRCAKAENTKPKPDPDKAPISQFGPKLLPNLLD